MDGHQFIIQSVESVVVVVVVVVVVFFFFFFMRYPNIPKDD